MREPESRIAAAVVRLPEDAELKDLVAEAFGQARRDPSAAPAGWGVRFTPPLPEPWPLPEAIVLFAYATTLPMQLRNGRPVLTCVDAMLVASPFASVRLAEGLLPNVAVLASSLQSIGLQGFGPAGAREIGLSRRQGEVYSEILALPTTLSELAQAYYQQWLSVSGVIAKCLPASQQRFFQRLSGHHP